MSRKFLFQAEHYKWAISFQVRLIARKGLEKRTNLSRAMLLCVMKMKIGDTTLGSFDRKKHAKKNLILVRNAAGKFIDGERSR